LTVFYQILLKMKLASFTIYQTFDEPIFRENERFLIEHYDRNQQITCESKDVVIYFKDLLQKVVYSGNSVPHPIDQTSYQSMLKDICLVLS